MKNYKCLLMLLVLISSVFTGCINDESFNQPNKYLKQNAVYISFYNTDSTSSDTSDLAYKSFKLLESNKTVAPVPYVTKQSVFIFFPFFNDQLNYLILPIDPELSKNTFILNRPSGKDTLVFDQISGKVAINKEETGYEYRINKPHIQKCSFDTLSTFFDSDEQLLYMAVYAPN